MKRKKKRNAVEPDDTRRGMECLGEMAVRLLTQLLNGIVVRKSLRNGGVLCLFLRTNVIDRVITTTKESG